MHGQPDPTPNLHREDQTYILGKGWKSNPIGDETVTAIRHRWVSDWDETPLREGERIPGDVLERIGIRYADRHSTELMT